MATLLRCPKRAVRIEDGEGMNSSRNRKSFRTVRSKTESRVVVLGVANRMGWRGPLKAEDPVFLSLGGLFSYMNNAEGFLCVCDQNVLLLCLDRTAAELHLVHIFLSLGCHGVGIPPPLHTEVLTIIIIF